MVVNTIATVAVESPYTLQIFLINLHILPYVLYYIFTLKQNKIRTVGHPFRLLNPYISF